MNDGYSGIENCQVNQGGSGNFQLILAYLKQGTGQGDFVIHATSNILYSYGLQPLDFLAEIGFTHYQGLCLFHRDRCFYRIIATHQEDVHGFENFHQIQQIHRRIFLLKPAMVLGSLVLKSQVYQVLLRRIAKS